MGNNYYDGYDAGHDDSRYKHPVHESIAELIEERDRYKAGNVRMADELATIAERLGCEASYAEVMKRLAYHADLNRSYHEANNGLMDSFGMVATELSCQQDRTSMVEAISDLKSAKAAAEEKVASLTRANERATEAIKALQQEVIDAMAGSTHEDEDEAIPKVTEVAEGLQNMCVLLARGIKDPGAARNYVEMQFSWDEGVMAQLPFRKVAVAFFRDGGLSPHQRAEEQAEIARATLDQLLITKKQLEGAWQTIERIKARREPLEVVYRAAKDVRATGYVTGPNAVAFIAAVDRAIEELK